MEDEIADAMPEQESFVALQSRTIVITLDQDKLRHAVTHTLDHFHGFPDRPTAIHDVAIQDHCFWANSF
jgi:hypothetical protein